MNNGAAERHKPLRKIEGQKKVTGRICDLGIAWRISEMIYLICVFVGVEGIKALRDVIDPPSFPTHDNS